MRRDKALDFQSADIEGRNAKTRCQSGKTRQRVVVGNLPFTECGREFDGSCPRSLFESAPLTVDAVSGAHPSGRSEKDGFGNHVNSSTGLRKAACSNDLPQLPE